MASRQLRGIPGFPRRRRALVFALICVFLIFLLPRLEFGLGSTILFFLISPDAAGPYGASGLRIVDGSILRYIDPLIGTTNGGL